MISKQLNSNIAPVARRDTTLDALKAFAIFFVCFGHCIQYFVDIPHAENPLWLFIYSFHMPLFISLVGYFSSSLLTLPFYKVFFKRFRQLIIPAITFSTIYVVFGVFTVTSLKSYIVHLIFDFWFLKSAFICTLLFFIFLKVKKYRKIGLIVSIIASQCITFEIINFMYPCFLMGYIMRLRKEQFMKHAKIYLCISAMIFMLAYALFDYQAWASAFEFSLIGHLGLWKEYLIKLVLALSSIPFYFSIFRLLEKNKIAKQFFASLEPIGTKTLGIYLIQVSIIEVILASLINLHWGSVSGIIIPLIIAIIVIPFICVIMRIIEKNRYMALFMLGSTKKA